MGCLAPLLATRLLSEKHARLQLKIAMLVQLFVSSASGPSPHGNPHGGLARSAIGVLRGVLALVLRVLFSSIATPLGKAMQLVHRRKPAKSTFHDMVGVSSCTKHLQCTAQVA